jgi:hypothetical protein
MPMKNTGGVGPASWRLGRQALEDWAEPDAVNDTDDVAYFWTREAEGALDMQALQRTDPADLN